MKSEELPPGPTWDEALAVIRQHDAKTAEELMKRRYALRLRALHEDTMYVIPLRHSRALAELESEALDLFEKLRQDGDRATVTALESREVKTGEPDPV